MAGNVRAPLFDRLVGRDPRSLGGRRPSHTLTREGLKESVRKELATLFNTRSALPASLLLTHELTVIDYGIPDLSDFSAANVEDHARLAALVARAVAAFEPRLREVRVVAGGYEESARSLALTIEGTLVVDAWREPVSFLTILGVKSGETTVMAEEAVKAGSG
ncbi:MAG TPA: type VI secretion system baseplate subunit TssE [Thermoanaerobaculia bacterium]|jgi:type VI secretion system lysozyme-like protein|nr:type VI secretion system baseplate subunit TssE [Thermoanaerobaculia bacterium]